MTDNMPDWYTYLDPNSPEKKAIDRFLSGGGKIDSWGYMAPELKAVYYEKETE
ncbi:hypothetical protein SEA_LITTLEFELLA_76 [Gordonia phage LittleFella]|nr:hypothetical protein SEA_LITTLEFELLA_76 [Gordonia phage LittleFella]